MRHLERVVDLEKQRAAEPILSTSTLQRHPHGPTHWPDAFWHPTPGGRLESYYWMFGEWDGFAVAERPDSATAAALALAVSSTGTLAQIATHELIPVDQINQTLERAKELRGRYQPIGTAR